jgi:drug/metabolite transporter (DMT)-like permease
MPTLEPTAAVELDARRREGQFAGHAALTVVQVCFGLFPIFGKWALAPGGFAPGAIVAWRMVFAAGSLAVFALLLHGRRAWPAPADLPQLFLCSILGVSANMILYMEGLARSTATNSALMICLIPVFTFAIAVCTRQETFRVVRALGVLCALCGASMLFWFEHPDLVRLHGWGNFLMVLNTLSYAAYLVLSRPLTRRYPPLVVIAWVFLLALPCVPWLATTNAMVPAEASARTWGSLAFILVFPTSVAYLLNSFALSRLHASTTAVYVYGQSLFTAVAAAVMLGEELTRGTLGAAVLIFTGIFLVARRPRALAAG